eukprot:CAMPEP_0196654396 /NCGR_PEP_ID=MMETSP1086-20130531/4091_1 /TAXON_ID=77921 /ORGANISM="Cyanoptyche  gloeocystis , Strain SAG4.97" /LENGTH=352 /DNA_ID=CAMNT_0041986121 /DNA_START=45 /DNA_END=1104 /DNA_ORIENTATION=+
MAEHLASIFGTEKDKVNCPFYFKTGACRHGDRCSRVHNKPTESQTVLISHMYNNPAVMLDTEVAQQYPGLDKDTLQKHFEDFYEEVYEEVSKFGEIEEMNVCDNLSAHLIGNVYVKFMREEDATKCITGLNGRFYAGRPIQAEYSPVTDFREASCRQFESGQCTHGGYCNFIHLKELSRDVRKGSLGRPDGAASAGTTTRRTGGAGAGARGGTGGARHGLTRGTGTGTASTGTAATTGATGTTGSSASGGPRPPSILGTATAVPGAVPVVRTDVTHAAVRGTIRTPAQRGSESGTRTNLCRPAKAHLRCSFLALVPSVVADYGLLSLPVLCTVRRVPPHLSEEAAPPCTPPE